MPQAFSVHSVIRILLIRGRQKQVISSLKPYCSSPNSNSVEITARPVRTSAHALQASFLDLLSCGAVFGLIEILHCHSSLFGLWHTYFLSVNIFHLYPSRFLCFTPFTVLTLITSSRNVLMFSKKNSVFLRPRLSFVFSVAKNITPALLLCQK